MSDQLAPEYRRRFRRLVSGLNKLIADMRSGPHPQAEYYLACDTLNLMSGPPHEGVCAVAHPERVLDCQTLDFSDGGDW